MKNYTILHLHTYDSSAFTTLDSVNSYKQYIDKAKELGMKSIAFTEHGNVMSWYNKKKYTEESGLKYIHGVEIYVTETLEEKKYDNYHVVLLAKNKKGFKELNKLVSKSTIRENKFTYDNLENKEHYYYQPRITYDDLKNTSDDIIILSACLGGILHSAPEHLQEDFIQFISNNNHRCFLELQHHDVLDQKIHNKKLIELSKKYNLKLVVGTDTHALNDDYLEGREVLQKSKNIHFANEDNWDLTFKSYEELIKAYQKQGVVDEEIYLQAIENTSVIADMVEEIELDYSFKYPALNENPKQELYKAIKEGIKWRNYKITDEIEERIEHEMAVFEKNQMFDFMFLDYDLKKWCRENDIEYGEGRGSVTGSLVAYLIGITHVNPIKYNLVFERFVHNERVTLADIDSDYNPNDIDKIKEYLFNKHGLYCAEIITYNTIALKGAIRDVGRALGIPLSVVDEISKNIETSEDKYRKQYPELFKYVDMLNGTVVSIGSHPAAICVADIDLAEELGIFYSKDNPYPILQLNMKEVESLNFLKLDVLKLDTIGIINDTCKLANIPRIRDENTDYSIEQVWDSIHESSSGIFQWNSNNGFAYYRRLFSHENIKRLKNRFGKVDYLDLFSIGNAAIRPAGNSYREELAQGIEVDYGHKALNEFLKPTFSRLIYQEQIIEFLNKFCGFTMGEADMVRRLIAKSSSTDEILPKIEQGFIETMKKKFNTSEEESKKLIKSFLEVIHDASSYGFSLNHSVAYSIIGYQTAYLREYHELEFITTALNYADTKEKMNEIMEYVNLKKIQMKPVRFRYSKNEYMFDKNSNSIYKGVSSIKHMPKELGNELYKLRDNKYNNFTELLYDIKNKTSCNATGLDILIKLDFFEEFGKAKKLLNYVPYFNELYKAKVVNKDKFDDKTMDIIAKYSRETESQHRDLDNVKILNEIWSRIPNEDFSIIDKINAQKDFLGYINYTNPKLDKRYVVVMNLDTKYSPRFVAYCLNNGKTQELKVYKQKKGRGMNGVVYYKDRPFEDGDLLYTNKFNSKPQSRKLEDGTWESIPNTEEWWLLNYNVVSFDKLNNE